MNVLRDALLALLCLALTPVGAAAAALETCEEVAETCLESCHVDFGMEKLREELTACIERCQSRLESCSDLRQEQKRSQVKLEDPGSTPRRGDPVDVYHHEETKDVSVKPAPYEDYDEKVKQEPKPKKKAEAEVEERQQAKAEKARQNDPDADSPPVKKKGADSKKKKKDLSGDDWAKE